MKKTEITEYQHYVPQCYLKNFSFDEKHIYVNFNKSGHFVPKLFKDVGGENYFYDYSKTELLEFCTKYGIKLGINDLSQKEICGTQEIEHFFADQIESNLFNCIQNVINKYNDENVEYGITAFSDEDKFYWSLYTVYQFFRTSYFRKSLQASLTKPVNDMIAIMEQFQNHYGVDCSKQIIDAKQSIEKNSIRKLHFSQIMDVNHMTGMARIHFEMYKWCIGVAEKNCFFITSDNPASLWGRYENPLNDLYFPISDKLCFILHPINSDNSDLLVDKSFILIKKNIVELINIAVITSAERLIFSKYDFNLTNYINTGFNENYQKLIQSLDCGNNTCYIVQIDSIQQYPGSIYDFLNVNGFVKAGYVKRNEPLLYINPITKVYRFGYYGSYFLKPINGKIYTQQEFIVFFEKLKPYLKEFLKNSKIF